MTNWITATGEAATSTSTLVNTSTAIAPQAVVGNRNNLEVSANGTVTANTPAEYTQGQDMPANGGVMATVQSHSGGGIYGRNPTGKDTVDIGGMRTHIDNAVRMGLLVRNGDGTFSDVPQAATLKDPTDKAVKAPTKEAPKAAPESVSFGEAGDAAMQELMTGQNPGDLFKTVDSVLHMGALDKQTIERMASKAGVEPQEMETKVTTVWAGAQEAAADLLHEAGVGNEEAFEAFLASNPQAQKNMLEAARNFFVYHKTEGLKTMADVYMMQADKFDTDGIREMLTEAGYAFSDKAGGGLDVIVSGTKVSWEVAVKQGIITFSKR
ncbi:hypothetical protein [Yoonia algicola]|uniref:Uncharacterized protein n=1 Tax=Yoonia algicola TaxID=3137368 RepID=A0AAN0NJ29_9RHOB